MKNPTEEIVEAILIPGAMPEAIRLGLVDFRERLTAAVERGVRQADLWCPMCGVALDSVPPLETSHE